MLTELSHQSQAEVGAGAFHLSPGADSGRIHPLYDGSATGHRDIELVFQQTFLADKYCQNPDDIELQNQRHKGRTMESLLRGLVKLLLVFPLKKCSG